MVIQLSCFSSTILGNWEDDTSRLRHHRRMALHLHCIGNSLIVCIYIYTYDIWVYICICYWYSIYIHVHIHYDDICMYIYIYIFIHKQQTSSVGIPGATWGSFPLHLRRSFGPGGRVVLSLEVWMVKDPLGSTGIHWGMVKTCQNHRKP